MDVYKRIRKDILTGAFKPGEKLREEQLASNLNLSRTPIREAIRKLTVEGLLIHMPNRGVTVKSYTYKDIKDAYDLRAVFEGYMASLVAQSPQDAHLMEKLEQANHDYNSAINEFINGQPRNVERLVESNQRFHHTILKMCDNNYTGKILGTLDTIPVIYAGFNWYEEEEFKMSASYHNQLISAIKQKDPYQAKALMTAHIYHGRDHVLKYSEKLHLLDT